MCGTLAGLLFGGLRCGRTRSFEVAPQRQVRFPFGANEYASRISDVHWWEFRRPHPTRYVFWEVNASLTCHN
jgi:hypothetical protein